jgi:cold shock CspA family protein
MAGTWNKREREKKKQEERKQKEERRQERKENAKKGLALNDMLAYIDENGNITSTPPDPQKKIIINAEDIEIGVPKQRELTPEELVRKGVVTFFNEDKGYGFIKDLKTQESIFVHINSSADRLKENNRVLFETERGPKGLNAVNVRLEK